MKSQREKSSARLESQSPRVFNNAHEAAATLRNKWKDWKEAGVQFSSPGQIYQARSRPFG